MIATNDNNAAAPATIAVVAAFVVTSWFGSLAVAGETFAEEATGRDVSFDARAQRGAFTEPGRHATPAADVDEILIGYFGPSDPSHPHGTDMWQAAQLALEHENKQGGYRGKPFRLVPGWSEDPWGTGVVHVTRMAYRRKVWAIIGGIDGPSTHLAEQVVAKARLALVSPVSSDRTVNLANVPWAFSLAPGDHLQAPVLAAEIAMRPGGRPFVLVSTDDHDARRFTSELRKALNNHRVAPRFQFECRCGSEDVAELVDRVLRTNPAAVVVVAGAGDSARLVAGLRNREFNGTIFGGPAMGRGRFFEQAGLAAEGVVFPLLYDGPHPARPHWGVAQLGQTCRTPGGRSAGPIETDAPCASAAVEDSMASREFAELFAARFGTRPDFAAAHTYDAVRLTIAAVRKAGLDRAGVRDALRELSPWTGVTGTVHWDRHGSNTRAVELGTISNGRPVPASKRPDSVRSHVRNPDR